MGTEPIREVDFSNLGVVDWFSPKGVEGEGDIKWRKGFLRQIGFELQSQIREGQPGLLGMRAVVRFNCAGGTLPQRSPRSGINSKFTCKDQLAFRSQP